MDSKCNGVAKQVISDDLLKQLKTWADTPLEQIRMGWVREWEATPRPDHEHILTVLMTLADHHGATWNIMNYRHNGEVDHGVNVVIRKRGIDNHYSGRELATALGKAVSFLEALDVN